MPIASFKSTTATKRPSITNDSDDDDDRNCGRGRIGARDEWHRRRIGTETGRVVSEAKVRGKRLGMGASQRVSDSEGDLDCISTCTDLSSSSEGNKQLHVLLKRAAQHHRPGLRSSPSLKELKPYDECSSQSSVLTDEDGIDAVFLKKDTEGRIQAVHTGKKDEHLFGKEAGYELYKAMGTELRQTVNEIRLDLVHAMGKSEMRALGNSNYIQPNDYIVDHVLSTNRENHMTERDKSASLKPDLLAEMMLEERCGGEASKAVISLLPDSIFAENESGRRKADDTKILTEEADRIIEDFILNVEDTEISLIDGERRDASSSLGRMMRQGTYCDPTLLDSLPAEIDGMVLPWLQWETCDDASILCDKKKDPSFNIRNIMDDASQISADEDISICCTSSGGSWTPAVEFSSNIGESRAKESTKTSSVIQSSLGGSRRTQIDVDKYLNLKSDEELLCEMWREKQRINTGTLLLCNYKHF